ncbi:MAG: pirin family protein [Rhodanobacteraceae bacterium]|nr:MAG: pirin family protein [Rhodanobacteraceae bacterium]
MTTTPIQGREHDLGHGLLVLRSLPAMTLRSIGPFVFFDHAGPVVMDAAAGRQADVRPHPHIGLSTMSYLMSGAVRHRDNLGYDQVIRPGDVNWMTAGHGIVHSERFDVPDAFAGNGLELLQSWVALPRESEECRPSFSHHAGAALPVTEDGGVWLRVLAGEAFGLRSPAPVHSPTFYVHVELKAGARLEAPTQYSERAAYVVHGRVHDETGGAEYGPKQLLAFSSGGPATLRASSDATVMLLGGEPLGPRFVWWNFVSSNKNRIREAAADWQAGRFKLPANDHREFIPLPATPSWRGKKH